MSFLRWACLWFVFFNLNPSLKNKNLQEALLDIFQACPLADSQTQSSLRVFLQLLENYKDSSFY